MAGQNIVFFGNCQARAFANFFARELSEDDDVFVVGIDAPRPDDAQRLAQADVLIEQIFDLHESPAVTCPRIVYPTLMGSFLWPYATEQHVLSAPYPWAPGGNWGVEWGDSYLNRLIRRKVPVDEAVAQYMALDIREHANLDRTFEFHLAAQRKRDSASNIDIADAVLARMRHERLFHSRGHPDLPLFAIVAESVCRRLGYSQATIEQALARATEPPLSFGWDALPMHPHLIEHFDLRWIQPDAVYLDPKWGHMTFERWARRYMEFDWPSEITQGAFYGDITTLEIGIARHPESVYGLEELAKLYLISGRDAEAEAVSIRAVEANTVNAGSLLALAHVMRKIGKVSETESVWRRAIERFPVPAEVFFELAHVVASLGRCDEAKQLRTRGEAIYRSVRRQVIA